MSQFNQDPNFAGMMNEQQLNQLSNALYSYCKVMRVPKLGAAPVVVTVLEGLVLTLVITALGESLLTGVIIGASVSAVFAFLCWLVIRYRKGASKRFNSYLAADGGRSMYIDFAYAQPFANDQFRLGRYYLFIKNGAILRIDSIVDIVTIVGHYRAVPTYVGLSAAVNDEHGKMSFPLCRVHMLNAQAEVEMIRNAVMQRHWSV
jgi:hypothetical protein